MGKTVAIHQPYYLPWPGFFDKMVKSDVFILLDDVKYVKNNFYNRNRIRTRNGWSWLTVPVHARSTTDLRETLISGNEKWQYKHLKTICHNYRKAKFFEQYEEFLKNIFEELKWQKLIDLNVHIINFIAKELGVKAVIVNSSDYNVKGQSTEKLINLCKHAGALTYYSGISGKKYLDMDMFRKNNIKVQFQEYRSPRYTQVFDGFIERLSILDLLLNNGGAQAKKMFCRQGC